MDESFLDDAIPSVLSKTIFQTFILMLVMRVAWSVVSFDRDTKIVSLKHLESSRSLHGWSFIPHIYYGYRYRRNSFAYCLLSTGCLHNETCNIWTHVFASLYFFNCFLSHDPSSTSKFVALAACYLFTVSSVAHSCSCHSEYVEKVLFRVDRASIALYFLVFVLVAGYQHFVLSRGELIYFQIFGMFAVLAGITSASMMFFGDKYAKRTKVLILGSMLMSILVPVLRERYYSSGPMKELKDKLVLLHLPTSLGFGLLGGIVFMTYFPERFYTKDTLRGKSPPKLGIFFQYFNSHSIMHVMVFASAWIGYSGQSKWDRVLQHEKNDSSS